VVNGADTAAVGTLAINRQGPGLFTADASGTGFSAAVVLRVNSNGAQSYEPVTSINASGQIAGVPIDLSHETDQVFLLLFGTGIRNGTALANVSAKIGGAVVEALYAGAQGDFVGLDQVNLRLPRLLAGRGAAEVVLTVDGKTANQVKVLIK
jgi:uncharacterized protein (TIGR03437 family)